jgi:BsuBI/PstI restriction endonuclease C-terminus.
MEHYLPPYVSRELISERLPDIFPEGTVNRNYLIREMAASTVFTMLYIGAIEGLDVQLGPMHVYRMTHEQSAKSEDLHRADYRIQALKRNFNPEGTRWYADNTREPIRDETLREGLIQVGAVVSLSGIATTSSRPRYMLKKEFAMLFDPDLNGEQLAEHIAEWQSKYLSKSALTRISLAALGRTNPEQDVLVTFPNSETRWLSPGLSSVISKAVIEVFAKLFLEVPGVLWLSTSGDKVIARDEKLAMRIGLNIQSDKDLPDIILVDLGPDDPLVVFIEVVATDGAISDRRQQAIYQLTDKAGFAPEQVVFVTAYMDKNSAGFKKTISNIAWNSFAWFVSEPENLVHFRGTTKKLTQLLKP